LGEPFLVGDPPGIDAEPRVARQLARIDGSLEDFPVFSIQSSDFGTCYVDRVRSWRRLKVQTSLQSDRPLPFHVVIDLLGSKSLERTFGTLGPDYDIAPEIDFHFAAAVPPRSETAR
jgi:hypothetical protein